MHVFWSPLERWTLVRQDEKGSRRSCVFTWCCITPKWFPCYCFNHQLLLKCQPCCDFVFHVCNDALPPGIQPGFGKSQELVTPCRTPARSDCALLFFPWDESFEYSVILFASGWDCGLRKWDNEEGWKKKKKKRGGKRLSLFKTATWCQGETDVLPWREQLYCHFDCVSLLRVWVSGNLWYSVIMMTSDNCSLVILLLSICSSQETKIGQ